MRPTRVLAGLATAGAAATALVLGPAAPASADTNLVQCVGAQRATYSPALSLTARPTVASSGTTYNGCVSLTPGLTSGTAQSTVTYPSRSCLDLLNAQQVTFTIRWGNGRTSTVLGTQITTVAGATMVTTVNGGVVAGLYQGAAVVQTVSGVTTDITLCTLGLGTVTQLSGAVTLTVAQVGAGPVGG
jgi:hypothetical protein